VTIEQIACICHEANRVLCEQQNDYTQTDWESAPKWQRKSAVKGVQFIVDNPDAPASASHDSWIDEKVADGWVFGPVKSAEYKTHPCLVPYESLPLEQQAKDHLFGAIVRGLAPFITE